MGLDTVKIGWGQRTSGDVIPVCSKTGGGLTSQTAYTWDGGRADWNTGSWVVTDALAFGFPSAIGEAVLGSDLGNSNGPGNDSVGPIAGDVNAFPFGSVSPDPAYGDPVIASHSSSVDLLINAGTVEINSVLLGGANQTANAPQHPSANIACASFEIGSGIANFSSAVFPNQVATTPFVGSETIGGTIDRGTGGTVQVVGSVQASIVMDSEDTVHDLLNLGDISSSHTSKFAGAIVGAGTDDTILLSGIPFVHGNTESFPANTLTIGNDETMFPT
jgi:hypothetical protein